MTIRLINSAGEVVGTRTTDGAPSARIHMSQSMASLRQHMPVHEEPTPHLVGTLGLWALDMEADGYDVVHGTALAAAA